MIYKASRLIVEEFDRNDIKYGGKIQEYDDSSLVEAPSSTPQMMWQCSSCIRGSPTPLAA